jgi:mRNA interferase HigB
MPMRPIAGCAAVCGTFARNRKHIQQRAAQSGPVSTALRPDRRKRLQGAERWYTLVKAAHWTSTDDVQRAAPKSKVLNRERVRFEVAGGNYRLVAAFDFRRQVAFVKFVGTHAEYDRIDALTISQF